MQNEGEWLGGHSLGQPFLVPGRKSEGTSQEQESRVDGKEGRTHRLGSIWAGDRESTTRLGTRRTERKKDQCCSGVGELLQEWSWVVSTEGGERTKPVLRARCGPALCWGLYTVSYVIPGTQPFSP